MRIRALGPLAGLAILAALVNPTAVQAEEIKLLSSVGIKAVVDELAPRFERQKGHKVNVTFGLASALKARIEGGESFDLAILTPALVDDLVKQGKAAGSPTAIARTGLGLMVRAGAPKLDLSSVDAFKRTLLAAKSLTYVPAGASGVAFLATAKQLGIAAALEPKTKTAASGDEVNANVTSGAAELAVLPVSEILPVKGAALGGTFPADVQTFIVMAGGVSASAPHAVAAKDFLTFLMSPANDAVIKEKGMERVKK
jgi:molybdate transport system substrate-binding protein